MSRLFCLAAVIWLFVGANSTLTQPQTPKEPAYDLVIRNGKVVDGSGNPWYYGEVAIKGDKIAAMGRLLAGSTKREINARGLIVAPGFIDIHSHSDLLLLEDGDAQSKIRQ